MKEGFSDEDGSRNDNNITGYNYFVSERENYNIITNDLDTRGKVGRETKLTKVNWEENCTHFLI